MPFSDESYNLRIELDTKHFECSPQQIEYLEDTLEPLRRVTARFPVSDLYITIAFHGHSNQYRVKTSLVLPGRTIATGDVAENMAPAYERCVRKLVKRVEAYKADLGGDEEQAKLTEGTRHDVSPNRELDAQALDDAVENGDYKAFRQGLYPYEDALNERVGRYIQRLPEMEEQLQAGAFTIGDVVEEVILNAFERYDHRPREVRLGEWLEQLIAPSVKMIATNPDEELQNISFARSIAEE
jgi:ribosome-associated translation inhibitor RaiA